MFSLSHGWNFSEVDFRQLPNPPPPFKAGLLVCPKIYLDGGLFHASACVWLFCRDCLLRSAGSNRPGPPLSLLFVTGQNIMLSKDYIHANWMFSLAHAYFSDQDLSHIFILNKCFSGFWIWNFLLSQFYIVRYKASLGLINWLMDSYKEK